jgi:nicotinamide-nucleotide amidase
MRAEIVCIGSELLLGDIVDTNTQYLARRLSSIGIDLHHSTAVGDNLGRLVECLRLGTERSDIVLTTGGLGPTDDDLTREAIAALFGETPTVDSALAESLRSFFELRKMPMTTNNLKQAWLIPSARAVPNARGTAPGWWVRKHGKTVIAMPGPPGEMHFMWEHEIEPGLKTGQAVIRSRTLKLFNISESRVDEMLKSLTPAANPTVAIYAKQDGIHVRITAKAGDDAAALSAIAVTERETRAILGDVVWGADDDTLDTVVAALLEKRGVTVAVGESTTAGQLSSMLAGNDRGAAHFRGGLIVPESHNDSGAAALSQVALQQFSADIGLGVVGHLVPDSDPEMHELDIAVVWPSRGIQMTTTQRSRHFRRRAMGALHALDELRKLLSRP